jgi:hypothetical protein
MIGRTLHGEIERDFQVEHLAGGNELAKIRKRAQFRMHGIVTALGRADSIGAARLAFTSGRRVITAPAAGKADRVNRCQADHVKAHRRDIRQPRDTILEGAVAAGRLALAARHHLVPRAAAGPWPIGDERKKWRSHQVRPKLAFGHGDLQFIGQQRRGVTGLQKILALLQDHSGRGRSAGLRLGQHARALKRIQGEVGAGPLLELEAVPPGREFVGPGLDRIDVAAGGVRHERSAPTVVAVMGHRRAMPFAVALAAPDQRC